MTKTKAAKPALPSNATRRARILAELAAMRAAFEALDIDQLGQADFDAVEASLADVNIIGAATRR